MSGSDMDDMLFQCNKNAIYVLNTSYAYGEFGRLNLFGTSTNDMLTSPSSQSPQSSYPIDRFYKTTSLGSSNSSSTSKITELKTIQSTSSTTVIPKLFNCSHDEKRPYNNSQQIVNKCKTNSSMTTTKKSNTVKSAIIAKKTKCWKYLEEEKWKKNSIENLSTTNCERNSDRKLFKTTTNMNQNQDNNNINNNKNSTNRNKTNENNNNQKSSTELYREAAELLGLSCTFCDNCRCLDCQSRYFECDDSDSYSEISFIDDFYETSPIRLSSIHSDNQPQHSISESQCSSNNNLSICSSRTNEYNCESLNDLSIKNDEIITD